MWLFRRKTKTDKTPLPEIPASPQLVRRTEITTEREWTSTVVRKAGPISAAAVIEGVVPVADDTKLVDGGRL